MKRSKIEYKLNVLILGICLMALSWTPLTHAQLVEETLPEEESLATATTTPLFLQPSVADIRTVAYSNRQAPRGQMGITLWGPYEALGFTGWLTQLSPYTGLNLTAPVAEHQLVVSKGWPGATGVQTMGRQIGINIHSQSIPQNIGSRGGLGTIVIGYNFNLADRIKPFERVDNRLRYSFKMKVPRSYYLGQGVTQVVAYFLLRDVVHDQRIWYGFQAFDSRGLAKIASTGADSVMWDSGTNLPIVHSTFGYGHAFATTTYGSAAYSGWPFASYYPYSITVSGRQLANAIQTLKSRYPHLAGRLSNDPGDYELIHFNFNPETYTPNALHFAHIGLSVRDIRIDWLH